MEPVLTPEEMTAVDAAAADRMDELVQRAGAAVARQALRMLGGAYGRRVHVMAGPGNNGADGRVAAELLRRRGVRVSVGTHDQPVPTAVAHDLLIDAAFGTNPAVQHSRTRARYEFAIAVRCGRADQEDCGS